MTISIPPGEVILTSPDFCPGGTRRLEKVKRFFTDNDRFANHVGIELLEVASGVAKAKLEIKPHHLNGLNRAHGAAIFALADLAFAAACNSGGTVAMGISVNISYLKAVNRGILFAEAKEISANTKLASYCVEVTDEDGELIATFQGMAYKKSQDLFQR